MTYDSVGSNSFKTVKYHFNMNNFDKQPLVDANNRLRIPLQQQVTLEKPEKLEKPDAKTEISEKSMDKSVAIKDKVAVNTVNSSEKIIPHVSEISEISFISKTGSRDLILFENKKPALSKTYYFNYEGKNFPGIITDTEGKIYIYDRSSDFHRPLKHLARLGDTYSVYHAGFREEKPHKKTNGNYIDLGTLEVLQAALQSSVGGKYNVSIHNNDSFMANWMHATSPNDDEKLRYWNDNVVKLNPKYRQNMLAYGLPLLIGAAIIVPSSLLGVSLADDKGQFATNNDIKLNDASKIGLTALGSSVGSGSIAYGLAQFNNNRSKSLLLNQNTHAKLSNGEYADTLIEKR